VHSYAVVVMGFKTKYVASVLPHEVTAQLELFYLPKQLFEMVLTSSKRITFSHDNDICNSLVLLWFQCCLWLFGWT